MWQLLLAAAAAAGSTGLAAKYLFGSQGDQNEREMNPFDADAKYQSHVVQKGLNASGCGSNCEKQKGIFRFSSPESPGGKSGSKIFRKESKKKVKGEKRSAGGGVELSKRRAVAVCLKKRRTSKNGAAERGASSSKDNSLFNWGLGIGIMYMMSAGKAEISKLNTAMDETAKVVQELKSEIQRRKSSCSVLVHSSANEETENLEKISNSTRLVLIKSGSENQDLNDQKVLGLPVIDDGECTSSVLTEERDAEVLEMDQLEAELESELQKLPWYTTESSCHEDMKSNLHEVSTMGFHEVEGQSSDCYQSHGVSPFELDRKLSRLLIKEQENQIVDLESELHSAQSKLHEKETELQALKDCVKRLTEFSLSSIPGDATEAREEQDSASERDCSNEVELQSRPVVGMKRPVGPEYCNYYIN